MSHIVSISTRVRDRAAIGVVCRRLGLAEPIDGTAKLFGGEATGLLLRLPDWTYPAVIDVQTGEVKFDNFEGRWGDQQQLDRFLQCYAVETAKTEAHRKNYAVTETVLEDGSIRLQIYEGG